MIEKWAFNRIFNFTQTIYGVIFREKMGTEEKRFFTNLSYVGLSTAIASIFSVVFNVYSGKTLGPTEYGKFTLIQSISMFLYIPMMLGYHTSMVKYNTEVENFSRQKSVISNTYIIVIILISGSIFFYGIFSRQICNIFNINEKTLFFSIILACFFVLYTLTAETLRSLHYLKEYSFFQPFFSIIVLISFTLLINQGIKSSNAILYSIYLAYGIPSILIIYTIRKYFGSKINKSWVSCLTTYSNYAVIGGISFSIFSNTDKILISNYIGIMDVGIYRAYYYCFTSIIMLFSGAVSSVLFPFASMSQNKKLLFNKINLIIPYIVALGIPFAFFLGIILLKLYGNEYDFDLKLALTFNICGVIIFINGLYAQLMNSIGVKGIKIGSLTEIFMAIINILLDICLIPRYGTIGAVVALITAYMFSIYIMYTRMHNHFNLVVKN